MSSKLGPMYQSQPERGSPTTEVVRNGNFEWVKGIDMGSWPEAPMELFPGKRLLARFWIGGDGIEHDYMLEGASGADAYFARLRERYIKVHAGGVRDVLGPNEPHPYPDNWQAFEAFEKRWAELVASIGFKPWVWSFGVGWPGLEIGGDQIHVSMFADSIQTAIDLGGGLELHEYGAPQVLSGDGWWTMRYRKVLNELFAAGVIRVPIFIGECGIDGGVIGEAGQGWKHYASQEDYWAQLAAYDNLLLEDPEIQGASAFVTNPYGKWGSFDVAEWLLQQMADKHGDDPVPPVPPLEERVAKIETVLIQYFTATADTLRGQAEIMDLCARVLGAEETGE